MPLPRSISILHVEVGGSYGGSLRALETYLTHAGRTDFVHDLLFYYPTPGAERLAAHVREISVLHDSLPPMFGAASHRGYLHTNLGASFLRRPLTWVHDWLQLGMSWPTILALKRILRRGAYDIVHVNNTFPYQAATLLAAKMAHVPVVARARGTPVRQTALNRILMRLTDFVVTVNRSLEEEIKGWGLSVPVRACYNSVETQPHDDSAATLLRASFVPTGGTFVGSAGRLEHEKGYECFIRAAARVAETEPDVRFAIAGEGSLRPRLTRLIADLNLTGRFHLCGFRADISNFLSALDLFVCSSLWEGDPLSLIEALLMGKPAVSTAVGVAPEVLVPGTTGGLVKHGTSESLAACILGALAEIHTGHINIEEARRRALALTNPESNAEAFNAVIDDVFSRKVSPDV